MSNVEQFSREQLIELVEVRDQELSANKKELSANKKELAETKTELLREKDISR